MLDLSDNQLAANILRAEIISIARDFFGSTDDYVDIESIIYRPERKSIRERHNAEMVVLGHCNFQLDFTVDFANEDSGTHTCFLHNITFCLGDGQFDMTEALKDMFADHIQSTGLAFLVTISRK
jgi:hypothetical protein